MDSSRRLAAIMFTDIVGYTALAAKDEEAALKLIDLQREILKPIVEEYHGKWLKEIGDGLLLSYDSSKLAVNSAIKIQQTIKGIKHLNLRIGIHQGDILEKSGDVFGDDVNISSRIEPFAAVGGVAISNKVNADISGSPEIATKYIGRPKLKGVDQKVEVYCITSHGLPVTKLSDVSAKLEKQPSYWLRYIVPLMLIVVAGLYFLRSDNLAIKSIAVLPLENLSNDPEQEYFVDGMMNEMINNLSMIGALRIISRTSVMRYKDTDIPIAQIARELGVDAVVEGSVLRIRDTVHITTRLIRTKHERNLWSKSYRRNLDHILDLHSEVAQDIAQKIKAMLSPQEEVRLTRDRPVNTDAYELYLKGQFHLIKQSTMDIDAALDYFELALKKDPNYALAYVGIAGVWSSRQMFGIVPPHEARPRAKTAALKALELDRTLAEAHYRLGSLRTRFEWDWEGGEAAFALAIQLNPNYPAARAGYSRLLQILGRPAEAMVQIEHALDLDPFNDLFQGYYGWILLLERRYDEAIAQFQNALKTAPNSPSLHAGLLNTFYAQGRYEEALEEWKRLFFTPGEHGLAEIMERGYAEGGIREATHRAAEMWESRSDTIYVPIVGLANLFAAAGETDRALDWLERGFDVRAPNMTSIGVIPILHSLHDDPRFQDLLRRMNLPENKKINKE